MTHDPSAGSSTIRRDTLLGIAVMVAVLAAVVAVAMLSGNGHPRRLEAVAFAAGVTAIASIGGWIAARQPPANAAGAVAGALAGTVFRLFPPLAALAWLAGRGAPLREAGAGGLLVAFYLALLATAVLLHIMVTPPRPAVRR